MKHYILCIKKKKKKKHALGKGVLNASAKSIDLCQPDIGQLIDWCLTPFSTYFSYIAAVSALINAFREAF